MSLISLIRIISLVFDPYRPYTPVAVFRSFQNVDRLIFHFLYQFNWNCVFFYYAADDVSKQTRN